MFKLSRMEASLVFWILGSLGSNLMFWRTFAPATDSFYVGLTSIHSLTIYTSGTRRLKQIGVNEITDSRELPFFIQWLTADHPSQDGKAVAAIEKITIADTDHLADSCFKTEILDGFNGADVEFIDPSTNDVDSGIVAVHLMMHGGVVRLD